MPEDKRQNEIIRIQKKRNNFVMLDKGFLEDNRLSYKAKGLLAYLLSKPDNWKVIVKDLINHSKDGKKAVYSGLKELKEFGYYRKTPIRDDKGQRISHWESIIYETPTEPEPLKEICLFPQNGEVDKKPIISTFSLLPHFVHIDNVQIQNEDIQNGERNKNYINNNNYTNTESKSSQSQTGQLTLTVDNEPAQQIKENMKKEPDTTHADQSNGLLSSLEITQFPTDDYITYEEIIKSNISYDDLIQSYQHERNTIDELINAMLDVICTKDETVKINSEVKSRSMVKSVYLKINYSDIEHVLDRFKDQHHKVTHVHSYLKTMLYTVKQESGHYYTNAVRADGVVW